ncbi:myb/SANT-like DNA-binding domain-containing protein 4 [Rhagoletis pomonella]|uniref:myb/SANT-like DNA-binding domain-containing protein 4 n=1 Tax=Rhagoletis pomonella TaxID=28610 RepID=UPI00177D2849|nr:myb/SANT-like DNA-binding domain-containing protein 4 [Rhagoletis pomonella]
MENSQLKRKRGKNFTSQEEVVLVELVDDQRDVIESKKSDAVTWKQKEEAWKKLAERFTARIGVQREWKTLRDKFESLKRKSKAEMASEKCELYRTGGGSAAVRSNSVITQKVATILGESATGMENAFDGDAIDISTPEKSKVHHEEPNNSDDLNQASTHIYRRLK